MLAGCTRAVGPVGLSGWCCGCCARRGAGLAEGVGGSRGCGWCAKGACCRLRLLLLLRGLAEWIGRSRGCGRRTEGVGRWLLLLLLRLLLRLRGLAEGVGRSRGCGWRTKRVCCRLLLLWRLAERGIRRLVIRGLAERRGCLLGLLCWRAERIACRRGLWCSPKGSAAGSGSSERIWLRPEGCGLSKP